MIGGETRQWGNKKSAHLPPGGLKILVRSVSIASKKSVNAFVVSSFAVSFGGAPSGTVGAGVDDADAGSTV